ncbi:MAG: hypothetical protein ACHP85_14535 [Burkholderiales bacterium]|jgi:hypothetical protein
MPDVQSSDLDAMSAAGSTDRVFVLQRQGPVFVVRPGVLVADGNQVRFRNFTDFPLTIEADFLNLRSFSLTPKGSAGDRRTVNLAQPPIAGFHEYRVTVNGPSGPVEATGDSRPGAIIDR